MDSYNIICCDPDFHNYRGWLGQMVGSCYRIIGSDFHSRFEDFQISRELDQLSYNVRNTKEGDFYDAGIQGYDTTDDKEALFVERVESLISRENTLWIITHEKEEKIAKH